MFLKFSYSYKSQFFIGSYTLFELGIYTLEEFTIYDLGFTIGRDGERERKGERVRVSGTAKLHDCKTSSCYNTVCALRNNSSFIIYNSYNTVCAPRNFNCKTAEPHNCRTSSSLYYNLFHLLNLTCIHLQIILSIR
jgi:hypothetical protein